MLVQVDVSGHHRSCGDETALLMTACCLRLLHDSPPPSYRPIFQLYDGEEVGKGTSLCSGEVGRLSETGCCRRLDLLMPAGTLMITGCKKLLWHKVREACLT